MLYIVQVSHKKPSSLGYALMAVIYIWAGQVYSVRLQKSLHFPLGKASAMHVSTWQMTQR